MYEKDKSNRITLRLNQQQFDFVKSNADILGVSPSEFLRIVINSTMALSNTATQSIKEGLRRANEQTNFDNQL